MTDQVLEVTHTHTQWRRSEYIAIALVPHSREKKQKQLLYISGIKEETCIQLYSTTVCWRRTNSPVSAGTTVTVIRFSLSSSSSISAGLRYVFVDGAKLLLMLLVARWSAALRPSEKQALKASLLGNTVTTA